MVVNPYQPPCVEGEQPAPSADPPPRVSRLAAWSIAGLSLAGGASGWLGAYRVVSGWRGGGCAAPLSGGNASLPVQGELVPAFLGGLLVSAAVVLGVNQQLRKRADAYRQYQLAEHLADEPLRRPRC